MTEQEQKIELKLVENKNLERFSEMFKLCFPYVKLKKHFKEYAQWKYVENPIGEAVGFEAIGKNKSAAYYGVIPEKYFINGEELLVFQSMDTMTHPDYWKKGLFTKLAKQTYEFIIQSYGSVLILGISGSHSTHGFLNKLNWRLVKNINYTFIPRFIFYFLNFFKNQPSKKLEVLHVNYFDAEYDDFCSKKESIGIPIVKKMTSEYLNWKITKHQYHNFHTVKIMNTSSQSAVGYAIYLMTTSKKCLLYYTDFLNQKEYENGFNILLDFIFKKTKANFIFTWEPSIEYKKQIFKKHGFIINKFNRGPFAYKIPFIVFSSNPIFKGVNVCNYQSYDAQPILQD